MFEEQIQELLRVCSNTPVRERNGGRGICCYLSRLAGDQ